MIGSTFAGIGLSGIELDYDPLVICGLSAHFPVHEAVRHMLHPQDPFLQPLRITRTAFDDRTNIDGNGNVK